MSVPHPTLSPHRAFFSAVLSGQMAAYMLGMAPMPPPQPNEVAVALANHVLDHPDANLNPEFHQTGNVRYITNTQRRPVERGSYAWQ